MIKNGPFDPMVPPQTKMRMFKLQTERRPLAPTICKHDAGIRQTFHGCVIDDYCVRCGEWLGDKDVS